MLIICVPFCSCLCKVCSRVSEALLLALQTLSLTNISSSDSKVFLRFIVFSGSPTAVHHSLQALQYYTVGIPFWTARKRQSQASKGWRKNHNNACWSHFTHYLYIRVMERYTETGLTKLTLFETVYVISLIIHKTQPNQRRQRCLPYF